MTHTSSLVWIDLTNCISVAILMLKTFTHVITLLLRGDVKNAGGCNCDCLQPFVKGGNITLSITPI